MSRILTFHEKDVVGGGSRIGAAYYMEADYECVAVRMHLDKAPSDGDYEVDIFQTDEDGNTSSIFPNKAASYRQLYTTKGATITYDPVSTSIGIAVNQTKEDLAANDFAVENLEEGSWVHCENVKSNGGKNITVELELEKIE